MSRASEDNLFGREDHKKLCWDQSGIARRKRAVKGVTGQQERGSSEGGELTKDMHGLRGSAVLRSRPKRHMRRYHTDRDHIAGEQGVSHRGPRAGFAPPTPGGTGRGACATGGLPKAGTTQGGGQVFDRLPADQANFSLKEPLSGPLCQEVCYSIDLGLKARASLPSTATCWCRPSLSSQNPTPPPAGSNMRSKHPEGGYTFLGKKPGLETHAGGQRRPTRGISSDGGTPRRVSCSKPCFKAFIFLCLSGSAAMLRLRAGNSSFEGRTGGDGGPNGGRVRFEHRLWTPCLLWLNHDQTQEEKHKKNQL